MDMNAIKPDQTLDARGLACPMPLLKTKKVLKDLKVGEILEILGTDPGSKNDIPHFAGKGGNEFLGMLDDAEGFTRYFIKKGA
ncbi:MAG: sulfurtransferase TusA family protein [Desulfobacteraceae bacterium]|nr:sulfurtransferase TusA family protein [Desulfobacteraceae bacterium]MBU4002806.1 sulfurtransferase TusA family protein [Pseudomonadota bacterium]MBU4054004.1 sulfurtransferase TusA family protein [Pseudomonadota bacterium]